MGNWSFFLKSQQTFQYTCFCDLNVLSCIYIPLFCIKSKAAIIQKKLFNPHYHKTSTNGKVKKNFLDHINNVKNQKSEANLCIDKLSLLIA